MATLVYSYSDGSKSDSKKNKMVVTDVYAEYMPAAVLRNIP